MTRPIVPDPNAQTDAPSRYRRSLLDRLLDRTALMALFSVALSVGLTFMLSWLLSGRGPGVVGTSIAIVAGASIAVVLGSQRNRSLARLAAAHEAIRVQLTELEHLRAELEAAAQRDPLTGLLNRRGLDEAFERESRRCERAGVPLTVIVIDIDAFKHVNDAHGHLVGDAAIAAVADTLRGTVRITDPVARFGGDEFVLVLPEHDERAADDVIERVRAAVRHAPGLRALGIADMTVSLGAARSPADGRELDALLRVADAAMYAQKRRSRPYEAAAADD
jgi:diguanylate cyclase (GGDEF)-like protein